MADEIRRMQDYTASDINDNIAEVRAARGTFDTLDDRLDNIEGGGPSPSNPIASNCVSPMTGYSKSSSSTPGNISTDDTLNAAIGKLEKRTELNENNISYNYGGEHKNLCKNSAMDGTRWIEPEMDNLYPAGNYVLYCGTITSADTTATTCAVVALAADKSTTVSTTVQINRSNGSYIAFTANTNFRYVRIYASSTGTASTGKAISATDIMVCTAADWADSQSYAEHIMTNAELTGEINPTQFTVPTIPTGAHATLESGGYTVTGNIVIVNMRLRFSQVITTAFALCQGLPTPLAASSLASDSSVVAVSNNKGLPLLLNTTGTIVMASGATMPAEMVVISCVYVKA